ncbi:unnamed protein product [Ostreobium quekettii]|uniref:serine C-palmitoyltransferase n=1 Tax=Ostreobium quekettii TaxID=121088 RepID=A0A8S1ITI7_9CHLO|nr:unnamed protein product [Ostreobium quekettii]|eukprot:evm.model.scf_45.7 EVM.evm.TU.scf_45.7   scf_45:106041-112337(-)
MGSPPRPSYVIAISAYISWTVWFLFGHIRDFIRDVFWASKARKDYAPIRQSYEDFYTRRVFYRLHDCFNRPIASAPSAWVDVLHRTPVNEDKPLELTGDQSKVLNLSSYNYLGFAASDEYCTPRVLDTLDRLGWGACCSRSEAGTTDKHVELEETVAEFLGVEAAITFPMGFATNAFNIPVIVGKGCLIISDSLNHASIVNGSRGSGAKIKVFKHDNMTHLEQILRTSIAEGQPRTRRPWKKILIIVEGIYSMEGEICSNLKTIVALKKKYKAYLFLDEAHSIGAIGETGRGATEHAGVNPRDVDVMMGTFTKSFGSCGGYIGGSKQLIKCIRNHCPAHLHATSMSPPAAEQVISALRLIMNKAGNGRGPQKIRTLRDNSNYVRKRLIDLGLEVLGDFDSPVMPVMIYNPGKLALFSRLCFRDGVAVVMVGFPATTLVNSRTRLCISAAHTKEDLDYALEVIEDVADQLVMRYRPKDHKKERKVRSAASHMMKAKAGG